MIFLTTNHSGYPRVADTPKDQRLRKTISLWEKGKSSTHELVRIQEQVTAAIIREQLEIGIDIPTDGQVRWYDPISHMLREADHVKINGLVRFYDTNFYFRQPIILGKIRHKKPVILNEFRFSKRCSAKPIKAVLTGPYTLASLSINQYYKSFSGLVQDLSKFIAKEVSLLVEKGCEIIQIDEPQILKRPSDFKLFKEAINRIASNKKTSKLALYTYFGDAIHLYDKFQGLKVDIIGFDLFYSKKLHEKIASTGSDKILALGVIDARNTLMEEPGKIVSLVEKMTRKVLPRLTLLNPSCSLEYLPRQFAREKLRLLCKIKRYLD